MMKSTLVFRSPTLESYVGREFLKLTGLSLLTFVSLFIVVDFFEKIDRLVRAVCHEQQRGARRFSCGL